MSANTCSWTKNSVAVVRVFLYIPVCHSLALPCLLYLGKTWYGHLASHSAFLHGTTNEVNHVYTTCKLHEHVWVHIQTRTVESLVRDKVITKYMQSKLMWTIQLFSVIHILFMEINKFLEINKQWFINFE